MYNLTLFAASELHPEFSARDEMILAAYDAAPSCPCNCDSHEDLRGARIDPLGTFCDKCWVICYAEGDGDAR